MVLQNNFAALPFYFAHFMPHNQNVQNKRMTIRYQFIVEKFLTVVCTFGTNNKTQRNYNVEMYQP